MTTAWRDPFGDGPRRAWPVGTPPRGPSGLPKGGPLLFHSSGRYRNLDPPLTVRNPLGALRAVAGGAVGAAWMGPLRWGYMSSPPASHWGLPTGVTIRRGGREQPASPYAGRPAPPGVGPKPPTAQATSGWPVRWCGLLHPPSIYIYI